MEHREEKGRVIRAISGFFDVQGESGVLRCKARGRLRLEGVTPLVGDYVTVSAENMVQSVEPRRNSFLRPPVANLDALVVFASCVIPVTEPFLIDRIAAIAGDQNVSVILCVNKCDLDDGAALTSIYQHAGFRVIRTSAETGEGISELRELISGRFVCFTGNSGVGKSSVLNCLAPELVLPVGEVSKKLGRGRHTTRHVELYRVAADTFVADTPGFSSFDTERMELILKENLQYAFSDFSPYLGSCQFRDCMHLKESGCGVLAALRRGEIEPTRHESYVRLYERASQRKPWEDKDVK